MKNMGKIVFIFLLLFVIVIVMSCPSYAASIWEKRKQAIEEVTKPAQELEEEDIAVDEDYDDYIEEDIDLISDLPDPEDIFVPDQYGSIIETHKGTNGKLVVHIQDAHCNYEGQMNSANIIESLIEDYDLNLILTEGGEDDSDFSYLKDWASLASRKSAAEKLLKDSTITGPEYLDIAADYPLIFQGVEDKTLYEANKDALWEIDKFKESAQEYVSKMIIAADSLKPEIYSEDLLEYNSKKNDYENETIDLLAYYDYMYKKAEANDLPLYTFPNFTSLIKASDIEKKIDLVTIRDGSASAEDMDLYNEYIEFTRDLNVNALFKEEPLLEDFLTDVMAVNSDQRKLLRVSKALSILKNLLIIKVVPEEYKYFKENKKDFDPAFWGDFLREKSQELNISVDIPSNHYVISDNLAKIEKFYDIAGEREKAFLTKTNERMEKDNTKLAALVAGGFHTPALTKLLGDSGYSYVVVSPKVTTETDDELYRSILKR